VTLAPESVEPHVTEPGPAIAVEIVSKLFRALGDSTRLDLLKFLIEHGEATGSECVQRAGLSQGRVSAHLSCLVSCGLVSTERHGRYVYYRVADERVSQLVNVGTSVSTDHARSIAACFQVDSPSSLL
jgi:DNA-binding transcriptional ArsR family regulator